MGGGGFSARLHERKYPSGVGRKCHRGGGVVASGRRLLIGGRRKAWQRVALLVASFFSFLEPHLLFLFFFSFFFSFFLFFRFFFLFYSPGTPILCIGVVWLVLRI